MSTISTSCGSICLLHATSTPATHANKHVNAMPRAINLKICLDVFITPPMPDRNDAALPQAHHTTFSIVMQSPPSETRAAPPAPRFSALLRNYRGVAHFRSAVSFRGSTITSSQMFPMPDMGDAKPVRKAVLPAPQSKRFSDDFASGSPQSGAARDLRRKNFRWRASTICGGKEPQALMRAPCIYARCRELCLAATQRRQ